MVTVCKYFLTNSCRYGDNCRFSHVLPNESYRSNPYVYDARQKSEGVSVMQRLAAQKSSPSPTNIDEIDKLMPEYLKKISEDVDQIEHRQMWPLTCYAFCKTQGNFPGWNDVSMEEVRWEAYQAQANGTTHIYLAKVQELLGHAKELRDMFLRPNAQTEALVKNYMKGIYSIPTNNMENVSFTAKQPSNTLTNFSFASAFENSPSVFNQTPNSGPPSGFFDQALSSNTFNQIPSSPQSFFGAKASFETSQSDIFKNTTFQDSTPNMEVTHNIFSSGNKNQSFGTPQNIRPITNTSFHSDTNTVNVTVYSKMEDLTKEEHDAFKANTFTVENLPFAPPPKELCL